MSGDRVANRFGRCFHHRKERFKLKNLKLGDHIVEEGSSTYWHHMIVEDTDEEQIHVIHYCQGSWFSGSGSVVRSGTFRYTPDKFYRIVYKDHECLPAPEVLKKAKARVDKEGPAYCPVTNNCEHFANECKTGKKECHQKWTPIEIIGKSAISSIVSVKIAKPMSLMDKLRHLLARMLNIKPDLAEKYRANFNSKLAFFTAAKIEVFLLFRDCLDASTKFSEGNLTSKEFLEVVTERICAAGFSLGGFQLGYLLGGVTALAFPGWWPLSVLGAIVGGAGVDYVAKLLGGIAGQQIITPLVVYIAKEFLQSVKSTMSMVDLQKDLNVEKFLFSLESIINDLESETKKDV